MNNINLNICQVSLSGNIPTILKNIENFKKYYPGFKLYIICPNKEKKIFEKKIKYKCCKIIEEDKIITLKKFKLISNKYLKNNNYHKEIQARLTWYYQQILKISFMVNFINKEKKPILMWDADTILLKPFQFFKKNLTLKYGTTLEYYSAYFKTNKKILRVLPNYFIAMTNQFIGLTPKEGKFLIRKLNYIKKNNNDTPKWLTEIIISSISNVHKKYDGSMFSEQELIGQSNLLFSNERQKLIHGIRVGLNGKLTNLQISIIKILNYSYVCYEYSHPNIHNKNMLSRYQTWGAFIKIVINKTSNKFFRGIKHEIKSLFRKK